MNESPLVEFLLTDRYLLVSDLIYSHLNIKDLCLFFSSCREARRVKEKFVEIQWLIKKRKTYIPYYQDNDSRRLYVPFPASIFEKACSKGYLSTVQWLLPLCQGIISSQYGIKSALRSGQYTIAKYLYDCKVLLLHRPDLADALVGRDKKCIEWVLSVRTDKKDDSVLQRCLTYSLHDVDLVNWLFSIQGKPIDEDTLNLCKLVSSATSEDKESKNLFKSEIDRLGEPVHSKRYPHRISPIEIRQIDSLNSIAFQLGFGTKRTDNFNYFVSKFRDLAFFIFDGAVNSGNKKWAKKVYKLVYQRELPSASTICLIMQSGNMELFLHCSKGAFSVYIYLYGLQYSVESGRIWFYHYFRDLVSLEKTYSSPLDISLLDYGFLPVIEQYYSLVFATEQEDVYADSVMKTMGIQQCLGYNEYFTRKLFPLFLRQLKKEIPILQGFIEPSSLSKISDLLNLVDGKTYDEAEKIAAENKGCLQGILVLHT